MRSDRVVESVQALLRAAADLDDEGAGPSPALVAGWAARDAWAADRPVGDAAGAWVAEELRLVETAERVKAWADAQILAALGRMHEAMGLVVRENAAYVQGHDGRESRSGPVGYAAVLAETTTATIDEVALATGLPEGQVAARLALVLDARLDGGHDGRSGPLVAALGEGRVSLDRATRIHHATRDLDAEVAAAVATRLIAPISRGADDGAGEAGNDGPVRSHRSFVRELRRQVAVHTPDPAQARAHALRDRCAYGWLEPDGTGRLTVTGDAARVTSALDRVDHLARAFRAGGDPRTLAQLRSDVALDLLLHGWPDPDHPLTATSSTTSSTSFTSPAVLGRSPIAQVHVVVALTTLLGLDDRPGELPGHGFVPAAVARSIATAAGSVWRRLVTDPLDGTAIELGTYRYRPTAAMATQVAALDGFCQAPGCTVPARHCDTDHETPWPAGPTHVTNLRSRHRRHHNHKTRRTWTTHTNSDGSTTWTTPAHRTYLTRRYRYDDPLAEPVDPESPDVGGPHVRPVSCGPPPF